jgi:hypothetical protein
MKNFNKFLLFYFYPMKMFQPSNFKMVTLFFFIFFISVYSQYPNCGIDTSQGRIELTSL